MIKQFFTIALSLGVFTAISALAQDKSETNIQNKKMEITKHEAEKLTEGSAEYFTGKVTIASPFASQENNSYRGAMVNFEAGARTAWHTHPSGQTLIITSGKGLVQTEGEEIAEILPGDVVWIPAEERHWHGASPDNVMSHVAIVDPENGKSTDWMEQVSDDDQYPNN